MLATSHFMLGGIWTAISHNWALFSILLTLLLLVIVPALVLAKYVRISLNIMKDTVPPLSVPQLCFDRIPGEERDVFAADGIRLRGMFMHPPPGVSRRGLVIFAPEFMSDRNSCARYCRPLIEAGYDVFSFDFRGHGESAKEEGFSPRQWASDREISDMTGVISFAEQWLEKMGYPVEIGLFGISRGACTSILVAAQNPVVKAIVVDGAFSSDHTLEHLMKRWAKIFAKVKFVYENHPPEFWRFLRWCLFVTCRFKFGCTYPSVKKALKRMPPRPLLFVHGQRDSYIPVEQSRMLYALAPQPKYLWIVQGAKHNQSVDMAPAEYARRTVQFFDQYLWRKAEPSNMYQPDRFVRMARSARDGDVREAQSRSEDASRVPASSANVTAEVASKSQN